VPAASVDEAALLAELSGILAAGKRPAFASWAREKTGNSRSLPAKRVYQKALAQMNGGSHGSD
jgi:nucleoid-associated protein YejK